MTDKRLTVADAKGWQMREAAHGHGKGFFFYGHRCVEQPRLYRHDRYEKKTRSVHSTWRVDGEDCASLEDAIERLNTPPVFTAQELEWIALFPVDWTDLRHRRDEFPFGMCWRLRDKGAIEAEDGKARLTELGRLRRDAAA